MGLSRGQNLTLAPCENQNMSFCDQGARAIVISRLVLVTSIHCTDLPTRTETQPPYLAEQPCSDSVLTVWPLHQKTEDYLDNKA